MGCGLKKCTQKRINADQTSLNPICLSTGKPTSINDQFGQYGCCIPRKPERSQSMTVMRFVLEIHRKIKCEAPEVKSKQSTLFIIRSWSSGSESAINLLHRRDDIRSVEQCTAAQNKEIGKVEVFKRFPQITRRFFSFKKVLTNISAGPASCYTPQSFSASDFWSRKSIETHPEASPTEDHDPMGSIHITRKELHKISHHYFYY